MTGRIILKCVFKTWDEGYGMDRSGLDRDRWRAVVNAVMNLPVWNFLAS